MSIEIRLQRKERVPWGFRLIGGTDFEIPLTIVKVQKNSIAHDNGLCNSDVLVSINGKPAHAMSHDEAHDSIVRAGHDLQLIVCRGPFDHLQEMGFEPTTHTQDTDHTFQPSEVERIERSASPFLIPTRPYRPFSTEPIINVPPVEDPIILNPNYNDEFPSYKIEDKIETIFKLPISPQYVPEGGSSNTQSQKTNKVNIKITNENTSVIKETKNTIVTDVKMTEEEILFEKQMNNELDIVKIEETACNIVDESLEAALTVTEAIKKEIDAVSSNVETKLNSTETDASKESIKSEHVKEYKSTNTTSEINKEQTTTVIEIMTNEDRTNVIHKESKTDQNKSENTKKGAVVKTEISKINKNLNEIKTEENEKIGTKQEFNEIKTDKNKTATTNNTISSSKSSVEEKIKTEKNNTRVEAEQRAYVLGLQTIPNIRGRVKSGYHYDMLLKTFFIHLTDVMVALSRFILTDIPLSKTNSSDNLIQMTEAEVKTQTVKKTQMNQEQSVSQTKIVEEQAVNSKRDVSENTSLNVKTKKEEAVEQVKEQTDQEAIEVQEKKSGSKMAQLTAKKSEELIQNMDAVVSEFQSKTVETNDLETRRSRSKSRIEEEVSAESDPLEWLSKREVNTTSNVTKNSSKIQKTTEHITESSETQSSNAKTYIAIVEAHVYTNKDLISDYDMKVSELTDKSEVIAGNVQDEVSTVTEGFSHSEASTKTSETTAMSTDVQKDTYEQKVELTNKTIDNEVKSHIEEIISNEITTEQSAEAAIQVTEQIKNENVLQNEFLTQTKPVEISSVIKEQFTNKIKDQIIENASDEKELAIEEVLKEDFKMTEDIEERLEVVENSKGEILEEIIRESENEMTLEEAIAKSNIAIITCEPIMQMTVETDLNNEQKVVQSSKIEQQRSEQTTVENFKIKQRNFEQSNIEDLRIEQQCFVQTNIETSKTEQTTKIEKQHNLEEVEKMAALYEKNQQNERKLSLKLNKLPDRQFGDLSKTPTPSTIPPTPLTDEYIFRLDLPLVESKIPNRLSPTRDHEDPNIVKKKLIPHIETSIERLVYDKPLASPVIASNTAPAFPQHASADGTFKEEIMDIERKSSLLASAIDETIKSIEEYKEQVGIENEVKTTRNEYNDFGIINSTQEFSKNNELFDGINENNRKISNGQILNSNLTEINQLQDFTTNIEADVKETNKEVSSAEILNGNFSENNQVNGFTTNIKDVIQETNKQASSAVSYSSSTINNQIQSITTSAARETNKQASSAVNFKSNEQSQTNKITTSTETETNKEAISAEILNSNYTEKHQINNDYFATAAMAEETLNTKHTIEQDWAAVAQQVTANTENLAKLQVQNNLIEEISQFGGTNEGITNTMEGSTVIDADIAKEIGKPGLSDDKIAELISGEAEMLREAHVMGLKRVIASHMTRSDDSSVDFKKIKPIIENLKDSEVLKALNEEVLKTHEEKKKEERKWTTFLQKPKRPVPKNKLGYLFRYTQPEEEASEESYKVKIIKQPKPKVAPDYKPEDFETGPLPWEERAAKEPPPPPVPREDPILIPEEVPEYIEAVDPLPESEVPDLEDTGIQLPKEAPPIEELKQEVQEDSVLSEVNLEEDSVELQEEVLEEKKEEDSEKKMADELLGSIQNMVDPNASLEQQLNQMRSQLAALAQLPGVIQQTLDLVTRQLTCLNLQETCQTISTQESTVETTEIVKGQQQQSIEAVEAAESQDMSVQITDVTSEMETQEAQVVVCEAIQKLKEDEAMMLEEQQKVEKEKKELERLEQESRQLKQRPTPRVGKPKPVFGPLTPQERPMVLPGGRKWRTPKDAYNEEFIAETLAAQAELIQGKTKGLPYESSYLPYDERINFMKYEKPPVSLDHLKDSDVYKLVHSLDEGPTRQVEMLTPVIAECDYREKCRSVTPCSNRPPLERHSDYSQQLQP